jgi:hypothetical protein
MSFYAFFNALQKDIDDIINYLDNWSKPNQLIILPYLLFKKLCIFGTFWCQPNNFILEFRMLTAVMRIAQALAAEN